MQYIIYFFILYFSSISFSEDISKDNFLNFLASQKYISTSFNQRVISHEKERNITGSLLADRNARFKLVYEEPYNEIFMSDGQNLLRFDEELDQLEIRPLENLLKETPLGLLSLSETELMKVFSVKSCDNQRESLVCYLSLIKDEDYLFDVQITVVNRFVASLKYKDTFGQAVAIKFFNTSAEKIPLSKFTFVPPPGTDIVRHKNTLN